MARKDEIFASFLKHELLSSKYNLQQAEMLTTVRAGLSSDKTIIKAIALIVEGLDGCSPLTDAALRSQIIQFLNNEAI